MITCKKKTTKSSKRGLDTSLEKLKTQKDKIALTKYQLNQSIKYLRHIRGARIERYRAHCRHESVYCGVLPPTNQVKNYEIRSRGMWILVRLLRRAILQHDWNSAAQLLIPVIREHQFYRIHLIVKAAFIIIMNHPNTTPDLFAEFIKGMTAYVTDEDAGDFILLSLMLRKEMHFRWPVNSKRKIIAFPVIGLPDEHFLSNADDT